MAPPDRRSSPSARNRAARRLTSRVRRRCPSFWSIVRIGSDYILSFVVFAVLARKLGPAAFGLFALAAAFAEIVGVVPAAGLTSALQRAKHVAPAMADTVFWASLAMACAGAAVLALAAQPLAAAFGEPSVAPLLIALGLTLPVRDPHRSHASGVRSQIHGITVRGEWHPGRRSGTGSGVGRMGRLEPGGAARRDRSRRHRNGVAGLSLAARADVFFPSPPGALGLQP
jgi:hypothetical protein